MCTENAHVLLVFIAQFSVNVTTLHYYCVKRGCGKKGVDRKGLILGHMPKTDKITSKMLLKITTS